MKSLITVSIILFSALISFPSFAQSSAKDSAVKCYHIDYCFPARGLKNCQTLIPVKSLFRTTIPLHVNPFITKDRIIQVAIPQHNINTIAGLVPGVDSHNGQISNIKGARHEGTAYYIDGVRVYE